MIEQPSPAVRSLSMDDEAKLVYVQATIHLPGGIKAGHDYLVDGGSEYVQECIAAGLLIPIADDTPTDVGSPEKTRENGSDAE